MSGAYWFAAGIVAGWVICCVYVEWRANRRAPQHLKNNGEKS